MPRWNLVSLPLEILYIILVKACNDALASLCAVRMTCDSLNTIGSTADIYKKVDVMLMPRKYRYPNDSRFDDFLVKCYDHRNPSAIYMCGLAEYFSENLPEGLDKINEAADAGYDLATYTNEMIQLILTADADGQIRHQPTISHEFCLKKRRHMYTILYSKIKPPVESLSMYQEHASKILQQHDWCAECKKLGYNEFDVRWERMGDYSYIFHTDYWRMEVYMFWNNIEHIVDDWPGLWASRP